MQRPEPALIRGATSVFVNSADAPLAAENAVISIVLIGAGAESGRTHRQRHAVIVPIPLPPHALRLALTGSELQPVGRPA